MHQIGHLFSDSESGADRKPQEHDTGGLESAGMDQMAKVLVFGEEDTSFPKSKADYGLVIGSRRHFSDRQDLMAQTSQRSNNGIVTTLVGEKPHHR